MKINLKIKIIVFFAFIATCSLLKAQQYDSIRIFQSEKTCFFKEFGKKSISLGILEILNKTLNAKTSILISVDSIETYSPVLSKNIDYNKLKAYILRSKKIKLTEIHYKVNNEHKVFYLIREL